jgi:hypothetical protein
MPGTLLAVPQENEDREDFNAKTEQTADKSVGALRKNGTEQTEIPTAPGAALTTGRAGD